MRFEFRVRTMWRGLRAFTGEFDYVFPNRPNGWEAEHYGIFKGNTGGPCWICGHFTYWVDLDFEGYTCSQRCYIKAVEGWIEACQKAPV
jgi:hypothetical protein